MEDPRLFMHKLVIQAVAPISFERSLKFLQFKIIHDSASEVPDSPSFANQVEAICWKVSRRNNIACIFTCFNGPNIRIIYQIDQRNAADEAEKELKKHFHVEIEENAEEIVNPCTFLEKAVECQMITSFLSHRWSLLDNGVMINGNLQSMKEEEIVEAVSVALQLEESDRITLLVAPDVLRFHRFKIVNLLPVHSRQQFDSGAKVNLQEQACCLEDGSIEQTRCFLLPFMVEGSIIGLSKLPPNDKESEKLIELQTNKYGLESCNDCFYVRVQYIYQDEICITWFPSNLVINKRGLKSVQNTIRGAMMEKAYESFRNTLSEWIFFEAHFISLQMIDAINPIIEFASWFTAKEFNDQSSSKTLTSRKEHDLSLYFSSLNFRRPKYESTFIENSKKEIQDDIQENIINVTSSNPATTMICTTKFAPKFMKRVTVKVPDFSSAASSLSLKLSTDTDQLTHLSTCEIKGKILQAPSFSRKKSQSLAELKGVSNKNASTDRNSESCSKSASSQSLKLSTYRDQLAHLPTCENKGKILQAPSLSWKNNPNVSELKGVSSKNPSTESKAKNVAKERRTKKVTTETQKGTKGSKKEVTRLAAASIPNLLQAVHEDGFTSTARISNKDIQKTSVSAEKELAASTKQVLEPQRHSNDVLIIETDLMGKASHGQVTSAIIDRGKILKGKELLNQDNKKIVSNSAPSLSKKQKAKKKGEVTESRLNEISCFNNELNNKPVHAKKRPIIEADVKKKEFELLIGDKLEGTSDATLNSNHVIGAGAEIECSLNDGNSQYFGQGSISNEAQLLNHGSGSLYLDSIVLPSKKQKTEEGDQVRDVPLAANTSSADEKADNKSGQNKKRAVIDPIEIEKKVHFCHSTGTLLRLTVPELKSFLSLKKTKVSGKKEELIQRVVSLLTV